MTNRTILALACAAALGAQASVFETNDTQRANLGTVEEWTARARAEARGGDVSVERALRLDRKAGEVVILAEFCGIGPAATVEFPIIGERSDRDYEALFRTFAQPGAVARAIEALGLPRGRNADVRAMNFWPYGERVSVEVAPFAATNGAYEPIQAYIVDMQTRAPLAFPSFVYCGSPDDPAAQDGSRLCDAEAPNSVLSTYNEPQTVIDMPAICPKSAVYERFLLAPDSGLVPFGLYKIRIRPARRADGARHVRDYALKVRVGPAGVEYDLALGGKSERVATAKALVDRLRAAAEAGFDPFVAISFDDAVPLADAIAQAQLVARLEGDGGIRVAAPPEDAPYYKGFLPSQSWRTPAERPSQPWELHFAAATNGAPLIRLVQTLEDWTSTDSLDPVLSTKEFTAATPEEALAAMDAAGHGLPVLLVFAPDSAPLSTFMPTVRLLRPRHPTVYFLPE